MNWKLKAAIQNLVALLPSRLSYDVYYLLQRYFGSLRTSNPTSRLQAGVEIIRRIQQAGCPVLDYLFISSTGLKATTLAPFERSDTVA